MLPVCAAYRLLCVGINNSSSACPLRVLSFKDPRCYPTRQPRVDLASWTDDDCILNFRFTLPEIQRICAALDLPVTFTVNRVTATRDYALALLLNRLAWPDRLTSIAPRVGLDTSSTGRIINEVATYIASLYREHVELWPGATPLYVSNCANAITAHTPQVIDIWAFIDGTARPIARPLDDEESNFNGHKRAHVHNWQGMMTPDGLIVSCIGPYVGSKNDLNMLNESRLEQRLRPIVTQPDRTLLVYGDLIYKGHELVMRGFEASTDPAELAYNTFMSRLRVYIETTFGKITQLWSGMEMERMNRTGLMPTSAYYICAVLFTNVHTCMHPDAGNRPWCMEPPSVERYLRLYW